jgi:uncharacterized membrane protein YdjX (TVP38/TMEM64 family)
MKRYLLIVAAMMAFFLITFFLVEALGIPLLGDPRPWMQHGGAIAASLGVGLLIADVLLPVPSSLVMVAHGALFGVVGGTLLSLLGSLGAALFGFAIGRRGGKLLERLVTPGEREWADRMLARWGGLAIVVSRPIPVVAETVAIITGTSTIGWGRMTMASLVGSLPPALFYALTGATVANFASTSLMFGVVLLVTGVFWLIGQLFEPYAGARKKSGRETHDAEFQEGTTNRII